MSVMQSDALLVLKPKHVVDAKTFAVYTQQRLGVPTPTIANLVILRKRIKGLFAEYPQMDYGSLCKIVEWAKGKRKRYSQTYQVVAAFRYAWKDGYLPELDPKVIQDDTLEANIEAALLVETDPELRRKLHVATTIDGRRYAYQYWLERRTDA